jgi:hypothetical protein
MVTLSFSRRWIAFVSVPARTKKVSGTFKNWNLHSVWLLVYLRELIGRHGKSTSRPHNRRMFRTAHHHLRLPNTFLGHEHKVYARRWPMSASSDDASPFLSGTVHHIHRRSLSSCPFQILGLKSRSDNHHQSSRSPLRNSTITYEEVRVAFRKLALKHHPDTAAASTLHQRDKTDCKSSSEGTVRYTTSMKRTESSREFTRIREAFEAIAEGPGGVAVLKGNFTAFSQQQNDTNNDDSKNSFSYDDEEQNGFLHSSVNPQVLHEVAEVARSMNPSGLDKGGMWAYANMIRNMAEDEGKGLPPLRVGNSADDSKNGNDGGGRLGRRRRRK